MLWEKAFGYTQAVRGRNTIYVSGQLSHDGAGTLIAPASLDASGQPADFSTMEAQMQRAYENPTTYSAVSGRL